jgi:hypothetical protein
MTTAERLSACEHLKEIEKIYKENEHVMDSTHKNLFINVGLRNFDSDTIREDEHGYGIVPLPLASE